jgi:hypothetical protein
VVDPPYASAKTSLLSAVARAHSVTAILHRSSNGPTQVTLVGFAADLQLVELLYTSLILQATTSLRRQSATGRAYRRAFLIGFAGEVGERLAAARREAVATSGDASTAVALRDRAHEVDEAVREQFPHLRTTRTTISDPRGLSAGRQSGAAADLSSGRNQVTPTHGPSLGR